MKTAWNTLKTQKKVDPISLLHGIKLDHWMISSGEKGGDS